jgi:RimJ/RimL family protein N-acetyltransferase
MTTGTGSPPGVEVPVLSDGVVTLRERRLDDLDEVVRMARDRDSLRWTTIPSPYSPADALAFIQQISPAGWRDQSIFGWAIEIADDDGQLRFAGNIDVRAGARPDIGYMLHPQARGRGVMSRAVRLATRWAFDVVGMPVIHWETHAGNLPSWRVAWACGFRFHGEVPAYSPQRGELRDAWLASLRADDDGRPTTTWEQTPELTGERVRLRPFIDTDVPRIVEACNDARTRHWLPTMPHPYTADDARAFVTSRLLGASLGRLVAWAVADVDTDLLLATVGLQGLADPMCPHSAELGYWAHPDARGRGAVTEAVRLAVAHAFQPRSAGGLGRQRVQLGASWSNTASRQVAERNGFTQVGRFRQEGVVGIGDDVDEGRTLEDSAWYDLLAAEVSSGVAPAPR